MGTAIATRNTEYVLYLGANEGAARCARLALASKLAEWKMSELFEDASLITSELVTNAARFGAIFTLMLRRTLERALVIEVEDSSPEVPAVNNYPLADLDREDFDDNGGRGLFVVQALADAWGHHPTDKGKIVWAVLKCR